MVTLENDVLKVSIRLKGAEIVSIFDKVNSTERLWQGNPDIWEWHAPNLFPIVGGCIKDQLNVNGRAYQMPRHGFARHLEFDLLEADKITAKFSLRYSQNTLEIYPYKFGFQLSYELVDNKLKVFFKVTNHDDQPIYFALGAHPAFNVPFFKDELITDYYLEFEHVEALISHSLSADGFFNGNTRTLSQTKNKLPITGNMFEKDALVFKNLLSRKVSIKSKNHTNSVFVDFPAFNYFGVWAKMNAPFICLEPWIGCADTEGKIVDISQKEGIQKLNVGCVFDSSITIGMT